MTNQDDRISPDLRQEVHHHTQGGLALSLLQRTEPTRLQPDLLELLALEGQRWGQAHYQAEVTQLAAQLAAEDASEPLAVRTRRAAEQHPRVSAAPQDVLRVLACSSSWSEELSGQLRPLNEEAAEVLCMDVVDCLSRLRPACSACEGAGVVGDTTCATCLGMGLV